MANLKVEVGSEVEQSIMTDPGARCSTSVLIICSTCGEPGAQMKIIDDSAATFLEKVARKLVLNYFKSINEGEVTVVEKNERMVFGKATVEFPFKATVEVKSSRMYLDIAEGS